MGSLTSNCSCLTWDLSERDENDDKSTNSRYHEYTQCKHCIVVKQTVVIIKFNVYVIGRLDDANTERDVSSCCS
jgi:hypothetical protein